MTRSFFVSLILGAAFVTGQAAFAQDAPPQPPAGGRGRGMGAPKNLQILKPEEVRAVMGTFVAGTGLKCGDCHAVPDFASDDNPKKVTARKMLKMVNDINTNTFAGAAKVTCYTCHRGESMPKSAAAH
jgi:photosynthetic reaction center cytochrome c subunit